MIEISGTNYIPALEVIRRLYTAHADVRDHLFTLLTGNGPS